MDSIQHTILQILVWFRLVIGGTQYRASVSNSVFNLKSISFCFSIPKLNFIISVLPNSFSFNLQIFTGSTPCYPSETSFNLIKCTIYSIISIYDPISLQLPMTTSSGHNGRCGGCNSSLYCNLYSSAFISSTICINNCSNIGTCYNGGCICPLGTTGLDCSFICTCQGNCNDTSSCKCACDSNYTGNKYELASLYSSSCTINNKYWFSYDWLGLDETTESKVVIGSSDYFIKTINSSIIECNIEAVQVIDQLILQYKFHGLVKICIIINKPLKLSQHHLAFSL
ncbi:hypothetical protein ACTFIV_006758 [Dictyostelium citrinum]